MAKALIGYMNSDLRIPARLTAENTRLRARVAELDFEAEPVQEMQPA